MHKRLQHTIGFTQAVFTALLLLLINSGYAQTTSNDSLMQKAKMSTYNNPEEAAREALAVYNNARDNDSLKISALIVVANAYFAQRKSSEGKRYAAHALEIAERTNDYTNQIKVYGLLGNHYQIIRMNEKARANLNKAEAIAKQHPLPKGLSFVTGNIYAIKGNSYKEELDCDFAIEYFDKAIAEFKKTSHISGEINLRLVKIQKGFCQLQKGLLPQAEKNFLEALDNIPPVMANAVKDARTGLGKVYYAQGKYPEAIAILKKALEDSKAETAINKTDIYYNLSESYFQLNNLPDYALYNRLYHESDAAAETIAAQQVNTLVNEISLQAESKLATSKKSNLLYIILAAATGIAMLLFLAFKIYRSHKKLSLIKQTIFRNTFRD